MREKRNAKRRTPKNVLRLPDLDHSKDSVLQSLGSIASERTYAFAINDFIAWYCSEPRLAFGRTVVLRYRYELEARRPAPATINLRLAAVRRLAYEASDNGLLSPDLAASIRRVKGAKRLGVRLGNWLTCAQGRRLLDAPDTRNTKGKRGPRDPNSAPRLRLETRRTDRLKADPSSAAGRSLGHYRFVWQGWPRTYSPNAEPG
jgi:hypothetical protein